MQDRWMGLMTIYKFLFAAAVLGLFVSPLRAEKRFMVQASSNSAPLPQFKEWVTQAAYYSSATCAISNLGNVVISTTPAYLHVINITSATTPSGVIDVFDAQGSTTTARRVAGPIDGGTLFSWPFDVYLSSGLAISIRAPVLAPCISVIYSEK